MAKIPAGLQFSIIDAAASRRNGATVALEVFPFLHEVSKTAPMGELSQFSGLAVANQYRLAYGLTSRIVPPASTVLDWGCGDGHFSYFLLRSGYKVVSYSLQHRPHVLTTLQPDLKRSFCYVQGDPAEPTRLPFADASFDAVFSVGVLEHVRETGGTEIGSLREIKRVLRRAGHFLCFHLPNRYSYIEAITQQIALRSGRQSQLEYHQYRFSARDILELWERAGLTPLLQGRYAFLPRNVFGNLPQPFRDSKLFTRAINTVDDAFAGPFRAICQNHFVIAQPANGVVVKNPSPA